MLHKIREEEKNLREKKKHYPRKKKEKSSRDNSDANVTPR